MDIGSVDIDKKYISNKSLAEHIFDNLEAKTKDQWSLNRELGLPYEIRVGNEMFFGIDEKGWILYEQFDNARGYFVRACESRHVFIAQISVGNVRSIYRNLFPQFR